MAIFGEDILWNGTEIYKATSVDKVLDRVFVVLILALLIVSSVCNPIVFWYHRRMKQNTPAVLFQILTANDFLTCVLVAPIMVYYLVAEKPYDLAKPEEPHSWQIYYSMIKGTMFCWSFSLTAILGTVRCIVIHFPFFRIKKVLVLSIAVGLGMFSMSISLAMYFSDSDHVWSSHSLQIYGKRSLNGSTASAARIVGYVKAGGNMVVSLSSAALSVWGLKGADKLRTTGENGKKRGGKEAALTIAYLNILIGMQFILIITSLVVQHKFPHELILMNYLFFLTFPFANTLISAVNPLIYVLRSSKIKQGLLRKVPSQISKTTLSGNTILSDINIKQ